MTHLGMLPGRQQGFIILYLQNQRATYAAHTAVLPGMPVAFVIKRGAGPCEEGYAHASPACLQNLTVSPLVF